jgi:hypothetical protein
LFTIKVKVFVIGNKASLVCSGEQVGLSKFGCSGNQVKKKKLLKNMDKKKKIIEENKKFL